MADDYPGDITTTGTLPINGTVRGHIDSPSDEDWFHLNLQPGGAYLFSATATDGTEPKIYVYGRTGGLPYIMYSNDSNNTNGGSLSTPYSWVDKDDFYLWVKSDHPVDYTVGVRRLEDDHLNDTSGAITLTAGSNIGARIDYSGDEEYFRISATMGSTYQVRLTADNGELPPGADLRMTGQYGWAKVSYARDGDALVLNLVADETKDYFVKVDTEPRDALAEPVKYHVSMTGNIRQLPPDDYADDAPSIVVPAGGSAGARLDYAGDSEYFTFAAVAGLTYTVRVAADSGVLPPKVGLWRATASSSVGPTPYLDNGALVINVLAEKTGFLSIGVRADIDTPLASPVGYHVTTTAADTTGPQIRGVTGTVDGVLTLTFSEPVKLGSGTVELLDYDGKVQGTWDKYSGGMTVAGSSIVIDPGHVLLPSSYTLRVNDAAVTDLSGNAVFALIRTTSLQLTTTSDGGAVAWPYASGPGDNDTAILDGKLEDFTFTRDGHQTVAAGRGQSFKYMDLERVMFTQSDDIVTFSQNGQLGQAWRLYQAAFDRAPDKGGLGYWLYQQQKGLSLDDVAQNFLTSKEYVERYGSQTNAEFVDSLYHNVLHRDGDAGGFAFHVGTLDHGASRADVLTTFSESPENQAQVASLIGNGIPYTPYG